MATIRIPESGRQIDDPREVAAFLAPFGIAYERWDTPDRVSPDASADEILTAYAPEIEHTTMTKCVSS
jgi:1,2-dihydroxy-3-keto-5-methylthiopentene dioxygenase